MLRCFYWKTFAAIFGTSLWLQHHPDAVFIISIVFTLDLTVEDPITVAEDSGNISKREKHFLGKRQLGNKQ